MPSDIVVTGLFGVGTSLITSVAIVSVQYLANRGLRDSVRLASAQAMAAAQSVVAVKDDMAEVKSGVAVISVKADGLNERIQELGIRAGHAEGKIEGRAEGRELGKAEAAAVAEALATPTEAVSPSVAAKRGAASGVDNDSSVAGETVKTALDTLGEAVAEKSP